MTGSQRIFERPTPQSRSLGEGLAQPAVAVRPRGREVDDALGPCDDLVGEGRVGKLAAEEGLVLRQPLDLGEIGEQTGVGRLPDRVGSASKSR